MLTYSAKQINNVVLALNCHKAVILPTDTVWGIISKDADVIYEIKHRPLTKKLVTFVNSINNIPLPNSWKEILKEYWPGSLTIIYQKKSYRIPNNEFILKLINQVGDLYSSSANISGQKPVMSLSQAKEIFQTEQQKIVFISQKLNPNFIPSTIVDLDKMLVIRQGQINGQEIITKILNSYEKSC